MEENYSRNQVIETRRMKNPVTKINKITNKTITCKVWNNELILIVQCKYELHAIKSN